MEDIIFRLITTGMKQKLIFSDMVEMRKIIKGAVRMMEAHYEAKMPSEFFCKSCKSKNVTEVHKIECNECFKVYSIKSLINDKT